MKISFQSQCVFRDAHMRVEVHDQQVLGLSVGSDSLLRLQEVCDVLVVQQEAVDGALINKRLPVDAGEHFNRHRTLVQGATVHRPVPATPNQLQGTDNISYQVLK